MTNEFKFSGEGKKKKKNRFRFDERMWAGLIFCSSGIFALFDQILEVRFFFLLLLFDVVYAVNWKGRLRYIYIRIINIWNVQNLAYIKIIFSMNKN